MVTLKELIQEVNYSQRAFAKEAGLDPVVLNNIALGRVQRPSRAFALATLNLLNSIRTNKKLPALELGDIAEFGQLREDVLTDVETPDETPEERRNRLHRLSRRKKKLLQANTITTKTKTKTKPTGRPRQIPKENSPTAATNVDRFFTEIFEPLASVTDSPKLLTRALQLLLAATAPDTSLENVAFVAGLSTETTSNATVTLNFLLEELGGSDSYFANNRKDFESDAIAATDKQKLSLQLSQAECEKLVLLMLHHLVMLRGYQQLKVLSQSQVNNCQG